MLVGVVLCSRLSRAHWKPDSELVGFPCSYFGKARPAGHGNMVYVFESGEIAYTRRVKYCYAECRH